MSTWPRWPKTSTCPCPICPTSAAWTVYNIFHVLKRIKIYYDILLFFVGLTIDFTTGKTNICVLLPLLVLNETYRYWTYCCSPEGL